MIPGIEVQPGLCPFCDATLKQPAVGRKREMCDSRGCLRMYNDIYRVSRCSRFKALGLTARGKAPRKMGRPLGRKDTTPRNLKRYVR